MTSYKEAVFKVYCYLSSTSNTYFEQFILKMLAYTS